MSLTLPYHKGSTQALLFILWSLLPYLLARVKESSCCRASGSDTPREACPHHRWCMIPDLFYNFLPKEKRNTQIIIFVLTHHTSHIAIEWYLDLNNSSRFGDHLAATESPLTMMNVYLTLILAQLHLHTLLGTQNTWQTGVRMQKSCLKRR
jgi:hypothetical protein